MANLLQQLKPHSTTGIKNALFECINEAQNAGLLYGVFKDREDCIDECEVISGVRLAVNLMENDSRKVDEYKNAVDSQHCAYKNQSSYQLQVYGKGCPDDDRCLSLSDVVLSVLGEIQEHVCNCPCERLFVQRLEFDGHIRSRDESFSQSFVRITSLLTVTHKFDPCNPFQLFTDTKRYHELTEGFGLNQSMSNEPWGNEQHGYHKRPRS